MGFIAESKRRHFWFGTEQLMQWLPTPNRGAQTGSEGWTAEGQLLNGGSSQLGSFGSHREYVFEWPSTSAAKDSQTMKSYADGSFGRGLIYFLDPLIYTTNIFPAMWADPSMGVGQEGATLVYGVDPTALPTSSREQNELPVNSAYYNLASISAGWRGKEDAIFLPVPEGYTLSLGAIYSSTGSGGVFYRTQTKTGALGAVTSLTALTPSTSTLVNTFIGASDLAGVWVYVGKSSAGASSVTATAMTARLLPSVAAVVTPVATNYAPSLYGPTVPVEVRRNLCGNPTGASNTNGWSGANRVSGAGPNGSTTYLRMEATAPAQIASYTFPTTAGETYRLSLYIRGVAARLDMRDGSGVVTAGVEAARPDWVRVDVSGVATGASAYIAVRAGAVGGVDFALVLAEKSAQLGTYFDGSTSPDPDLTARWIGAPNASESVLEGQHPTGFTDSNCVSIIHEVGGGTRELRQIPTNSNTDSFTALTMPSPQTAARTFVADLRVEAPLPLPVDSRRLSIGVSSPQKVAQAPNQAGLFTLRNAYPALSPYTWIRLYHGGARGSGDVYWSKIGLFEGDYQGPWFDGNSGVFSIGSQLVRAKWDGAPGASTSTAYTTSPELESIGTGPWIGGQGHSGCRFIRKPTETKNGPFNGGQVGFAASFTEVGSWLYG